MAVFSVLTPRTPTRRGGSVEFVRDGFSFGAALLGPIWCLWRRAWLALLVWVIGFAAIVGASYAFDLPTPAAAALVVLGASLFGLEAGEFVVNSIERRSCRVADILCARDVEEAEQRWFARIEQMKSVRYATRSHPEATRPPAARNFGEAGLGLFPNTRGV